MARMPRLALGLLAALALVLPAGASAQVPVLDELLGRLIPSNLLEPPAQIPPPVQGVWPQHWAACVAENPPPPITQPAGIDPRGVDPALPNPLLGMSFYVDRLEPAYEDWVRYKRSGQTSKADLIWKLAREPRFRWFGKFTKPDMPAKVRGFLDRVQCDQPGSVPQMAVLRAEGNQCHPGYMAGGAAEDQRTREWYDTFARTVGDDRVVIGFEPDSLGTISCLAKSRRNDRLRLLRYGVDVLSQLPNATIYLEAGASDWEEAARTAKQLRAIGIHKVRGFMLNVTHHDWTRNNIRHGLDISRRVGGKPFVINTSYNGRGPVHFKKIPGQASRVINVWCNPGYRGLGPAPTTQTSHPKVDAYFYINRPGYSAGSCNGGPLPVGTWWRERALMYATYATDWEGPPSGTRFGHYRRLSARALGISRAGLR
jgi:endoglucanase